MDRYVDANRRHWNELTPIHRESEFYDVPGFKAGKSTLHSVELEDLVDVSGKSLLHLQCHFGLDTMSWARLGARVTGVDFSDKSIELACSLAEELGSQARFILSDIYGLTGLLDERFDIVFTSYGVLTWLPDLGRWGQLISHFLKPGGTFYMVEFHPFSEVFDDECAGANLRLRYPYFHTREPMRFETERDYADADAEVSTPEYAWAHSMGDIVNSIVSAGLRIEFLHEFPFTAYRALPMMDRGEDGWWRLKAGSGSVPLMFSLKATKAEQLASPHE